MDGRFVGSDEYGLGEHRSERASHGHSARQRAEQSRRRRPSTRASSLSMTSAATRSSSRSGREIPPRMARSRVPAFETPSRPKITRQKIARVVRGPRVVCLLRPCAPEGGPRWQRTCHGSHAKTDPHAACMIAMEVLPEHTRCFRRTRGTCRRVTLHRLALDLTQAFGGQVVSVSSPQGRFAESAAQLTRRDDRGDGSRQASVLRVRR